MTTLTFQTREDTRLGDAREDNRCCRDFDQLVARYQPQVARLAHRLLGWRDREAVEDVVQEVFLVALRRHSSFRGESSLGTWLTGITINKCRDHRRRSVVRLKWLQRLWRYPETNHDSKDETAQQVRDAVAELPPRDREVIVLFYLEGLPVAQVAELLGAKNNTIEVRLHRARQKLKAKLAGLIGD